MWSLYVTVCVDAVAMIMTDDSSSGLNYMILLNFSSQMNSFTRSKQLSCALWDPQQMFKSRMQKIEVQQSILLFTW